MQGAPELGQGNPCAAALTSRQNYAFDINFDDFMQPRCEETLGEKTARQALKNLPVDSVSATTKERNEWSGRWDSNPRLDLGKVPYYPYTTAARLNETLTRQRPTDKLTRRREETRVKKSSRVRRRNHAASCQSSESQRNHPTWRTRAVFTTGDFRCRSANLAAFSRSVYTRANRSPSL